MEQTPLAALLDASHTTRGPRLVSALNINPGGVDPLGLRQINFRLMDQVIPGFNNIARHIRPYTLLAWSWHRAAACAKQMGHKEIDPAKMREFANRMEFLFVWSQFLVDPNTDLPGRETFLPYLERASFRFGDKSWTTLCDRRRNSTSLDAALNYGPAVKYLGWIVPIKARTFTCAKELLPAVSAFESSLGRLIEEPVFHTLSKPVEISRETATEIGAAWKLDRPTKPEQEAMRIALLSEDNNDILSQTASCIRECATISGAEIDYEQFRIDLCGSPSRFSPSEFAAPVVSKWRVVQLRQLFRLALEGLLHWITMTLDDAAVPLSTPQLVNRLLEQAGAATDIEAWLLVATASEDSIPDRIGRLQEALDVRDETSTLALAIREALAFSLSEDHPEFVLQEPDRLPIADAQKDVQSLRSVPLPQALVSLFEKWVFGQHVFWAVSRGLGDARARGTRSILRLKVLQDEMGWTLAPGINLRSIPRATADRIETFVTLLKEAGAFDPPSADLSSTVQSARSE